MTIVSLEKLKQRVQNLESIDNALDETGVKKKFIEENNKITFENAVPLFVINPSSPMPRLGQKLYRVTQEFSGFQKNDPSFYQHPPKNITSQLRCNLPKNPVFYCSDIWGISLFEVIQGKDDITNKIFYFTEWEVMVDRTWCALSFIFSGIPQNNPAYPYVQNTNNQIIQKFAPYMSEKDIDDYMEFYHSEFTKDGSHKFSSIVSYQFLYDNDQGNGDFVFYPSVQASKNGNNFAFNKKIIEGGEIALKRVFKVHVEDLKRTSSSGFDWKYSLLSVGKKYDNSIIWENPTKESFDEFNSHFPDCPKSLV